MAWMIKAGNVEKGDGSSASTLSIVSAPTGLGGWCVFTRHPRHAAGDDIWQATLANLIQQENDNEQ
jgi:hypothetical protein